MIEFLTTDGKPMWVGSTHVVSIITRDDLTEVELSDGTTWHAAESAADLGARFITATGMLTGASPSDAALLAALGGRPDPFRRG